MDGSYGRVHRDRREQLALIVDPADDRGFGRDLHGGAVKAGTEDRPADARLVE
jgi:hypothetical protein